MIKFFIEKYSITGGGFFTALLFGTAALLPAQSLPAGARPNILVIITDDQRLDTIKDIMPRTQARIFDEGVTFTNAFATTPLCNPSRASMLTGMYASHHGVRNNDLSLQLPTFVERLHATGYYTGQIGKYLNTWDATPREEYDYWIGMPAEGSYYNPSLNINGAWKNHQGYLTYLLRDYAVDFLKKAAARPGQPFFLFFNPKTPHDPFQVAPGDENLFPELLPFRPPSYNEADLSDKPNWLQTWPRLTTAAQQELDGRYKRHLQMLWSLDLSIDAILNELERQGKLDETAIFYISDNGFLWGEHRLVGKIHVYEPSIHIPFALRYPQQVPAGTMESQLVANIDLTPTICRLAGLPLTAEFDGYPLLPLPQQQSNWRSEILLQGWFHGLTYSAVRTSRYLYVEHGNDRPEFYDLEKDPDQLENLANDAMVAPVVEDMQRRLGLLVSTIAEKTSNAPVPASLVLRQNYPNPFGFVTAIHFGVNKRERVVLQVFDLTGRLIATLQDGEVNAGEYRLEFKTGALPNGIYFYRLQAGAQWQQKKLVIMR